MKSFIFSNGMIVVAATKQEAIKTILEEKRDIPGTRNCVTKSGNVYKKLDNNKGYVQVFEYDTKDKHKPYIRLDTGKRTNGKIVYKNKTLNTIMKENWPEAIKPIGKIIPNTNNEWCMDKNGIIRTVEFSPEIVKQKPDKSGRLRKDTGSINVKNEFQRLCGSKDSPKLSFIDNLVSNIRSKDYKVVGNEIIIDTNQHIILSEDKDKIIVDWSKLSFARKEGCKELKKKDTHLEDKIVKIIEMCKELNKKFKEFGDKLKELKNFK